MFLRSSIRNFHQMLWSDQVKGYVLFHCCFEIVRAKTTLVANTCSVIDLNFRYAASVGGVSASSLSPILR